MRLEGYDLFSNKEIFWDDSCDWRVVMEGHKHGRREALYVALYANAQQECMKLHLGMNEELTESSGVRINWRAGTGHITVGSLLQAT